MDSKQLSLVCPCCNSRLDVDTRTGTIMRWSREKELDETGKPKLDEADWKGANTRVSKRLDSATSKFEESLQKEKDRERDLDDLFDKAKDKLKGKKEDGPL